MASKACTTCLRTLQRHSRSLAQARRPVNLIATRSFNRHDIFQGELPDPSAKKRGANQSGAPERTEGASKVGADPALNFKAAKELRRVAGKSMETYSAYGSTQHLYRMCSAQADYSIPQAQDEDAEMPKTEDGEDLGVGDGWWHTELGLKPTFSTWSQVTMLHMYLLATRFRCFESSESQIWQQHLLDHFFYEAEHKMTVNHNMHARGTRNKYLKDMFIQWRGLLAAYDEGIMKSDAVLAAAIWRNLFKANEDVDVRGLAHIVSYVRRSLRDLDALSEESVMEGDVEFSEPADEAKVVDIRSKMLDMPLDGVPSAPPNVPKTSS
ncbi:hypothetical protein BP6252_12773 [Coleophoma cylindrospora]|uniref:Ubiquinol-cytochrome c chaperone domain-containing protein n=1 Tax=Coleophoma cylindrospora TaxID=1849047 RepID=A0A3D8QCV8_9HELO|nr:hypothetical protein BP6252_12773 [Coleophoma cylindrospora]